MIAVTQVKQIYFKFLPVSNITRHYHNRNKSLATMQQTALIYSIIKLNMFTYSCFGGKVVYIAKASSWGGRGQLAGVSCFLSLYEVSALNSGCWVSLKCLYLPSRNIIIIIFTNFNWSLFFNIFLIMTPSHTL